MSKKNIAVVYGGYSSEEVVSRRSAEGICSFIDAERYNVYPLYLGRDNWVLKVGTSEYPVNKADFSAEVEGKTLRFDCAYITIHGTPGEDGLLQGYLKMLNIPHTTCDVLPAALTFNKFACNHYLKGFGFRVAQSVLLHKGKSYELQDIATTTGFPCFVKPNAGGSSFGITKVKAMEQLEAAIQKAFLESSEVVVEQFIEGTELTCGLFKAGGKITILPLTEVISANEFFDFEAKYTPEKVEEITPARISQELTSEIQQSTASIYELLGCKGIVRIDYIVSDNKPFLLEVNTTPGMTPTSFIPQQIAAAGLQIKDVFSQILEEAMSAS